VNGSFDIPITTMKSIEILGSKVSLIDYKTAIVTFENWIRENSQRYVCVANVHTVMLGTEAPAFRQITNKADMVTPDGQPLRFVANMKGARLKNRVYGPTLMGKTCERFQEGYSHFFYGGALGVPEKLKDIFRARFPKINVVGAYSPPFRPLTKSENIDVIKLINRANPDFLWVGLGAPKQEFWMYEHLGKVNARIMLGVGAAFDFNSGTVSQAPSWMQKYGLEWAYRLTQDPKRLWYRYLYYNPLFVWKILKEVRGL